MEYPVAYRICNAADAGFQIACPRPHTTVSFIDSMYPFYTLFYTSDIHVSSKLFKGLLLGRILDANTAVFLRNSSVLMNCL